MLVTSCFREPGFGSGGWLGITALHQMEVDGPPSGNLRSDEPGARPGLFQAFTSTAPFLSQAPGNLTSGGVAVDARGVIAAVGNTSLPQTGSVIEFPIVGPPAEIRNSQGVVPTTTQVDALRLQLDVLPYGACRIDGTTGCGPQPGTVGGTTPACAISQFGNALLPAALERMFIDVDGVPASGGNIAILVDRPVSGSIAIGALWLGFPVLTPSPFPGIEVFGDVNLAVPFGTIPVDESWRLALPVLPAGPATFTIQFVSLFLPWNYCATAPGCGSDPLCQGGAVFSSAASPALLFTY
ncbi:MAG TPA: hypothetical protein VFZ65_15995 [Planctomycetota bacterium]|nr:hypothetical protein [Planctomycetota bacterium]